MRCWLCQTSPSSNNSCHAVSESSYKAVSESSYKSPVRNSLRGPTPNPRATTGRLTNVDNSFGSSDKGTTVKHSPNARPPDKPVIVQYIDGGVHSTDHAVGGSCLRCPATLEYKAQYRKRERCFPQDAIILLR